MKTSLIQKKNLIIAGPCSAEDEEQLIQTAMQLAREGKTDILRAGIWKPRTSPGFFEGVGTRALSWLLRAKNESGLPTAVEVATPRHVEDALQFDVDTLWVGARTTVNPFSVQQLADALRGTGKTILIKNPVNTDIKLWIGAVERFLKSGITDLGLIHRGFTSYSDSGYRNPPMWQIPIEMKRIYPAIPMIVDPSHICGNKENLFPVVQKSIDLDYDGVMIEVHCSPHLALTDKEQQLMPRELTALLDGIVWKRAVSDDTDFVLQLDYLREQINQVDQELLELFANRMQLSQHIGKLKKVTQTTVLQSGRWNEVLQKHLSRAKKLDLGEQFIRQYLEALHMESIRQQNLH
jgi:chorismate mutase